ncbi:MAG: YceI family protein [Geminicoccaceae bacterium]
MQLGLHLSRGSLPLAALVLAAAPAAAEEVFTFDPGHTEIQFAYSHLGNSRAFGAFEGFSGELALDTEDPARSRIEVVIDAASLHTGVEALDGHLKSDDFFAVESSPEIRFVSTGVVPTSATTAEVTGDLTIRETTQPVVLDVTLNYLGDHQLGQFVPDYADVEVAGFSARGTVLRSAFGLDMLVPMIGDEVELIIEAELLRPKTLVD